jgi:hypothetical protein
MEKYLRPKSVRRREQGIAFVTVLILLVVSVSLVSFTTFYAITNRSSSTDNLASLQAQYAAEAGIEKTLNTIYYSTAENLETLKANGVNKVVLDSCTFKLLLTGIIGIDTSVTGKNNNMNGVPTCQYGWNTNLVEKNSPAPLFSPTMPGLYDGVTLTKSNVASLGGSFSNSSYDVAITRTDNTQTGTISISFESIGQVKNGNDIIATRKLKRVIDIAGSPYPGDRFAMLTTASQCSMCHLYIDTMERAYDSATSDKTYDRALVGFLNSDSARLNPCTSWHADTVIAGTVYLRQSSFAPGNGGNWSAGEYDCSRTSTGQRDQLLGLKWSGSPGKVKAGSIADNKSEWFGRTNTDFSLDATPIDAASATGKTKAFGKVYYNYPTEATVADPTWNKKFPDEPLPAGFPAVIPDTNENSLVDDAEWTNYVANSPIGSLTGGIVKGFKRPNSTAAFPSSYDPAAMNGNTTRWRNTTLEYKNTNLTLAKRQLLIDLEALANGNYSNAALSTFATNWRGWLFQQALATPNNRDHYPTNPTFYAGDGYNSRAYIEAVVPTTTTVTSTSRSIAVLLPKTVIANANTRVEFFTTASAASPSAIIPIVAGTYAASMNTIDSNATVNINLNPATSIEIPNGAVLRIYVNWFEPISWGDQHRTGVNSTATEFFGQPSNGTGAIENNFHLNYNPENGQLRMKFCTTSVARCPNRADLILNDLDDSALFPNSTDTATVTALTSGKFDGNVIIDGGRYSATNYATTGINPGVINLSGTVVVNGDVVIRGRIEGTGRLIARGNIYVVGDFVYWCGGNGGALCSISQYQQLSGLPQIGLLAGGGIFLGDYDIPDGNAVSSNIFETDSDSDRRYSNGLDLINDQVLQKRNPDSVTSSSRRITPNFYNLPGSTGGTNGPTRPSTMPMGDTGSNNYTAGFLNELLPIMNFRSTSRKFLYSPFGLISNLNSRAAQYEDLNTGFFLTALPTYTAGGTTKTASIIPISPSNGPIFVGSRSNSGFATSSGASAQLSCATGRADGAGGFLQNFTNQDPALPSVFNGSADFDITNAYRSSFNFSFWCPPTTGSFVRADRLNDTLGATPANDASAWMSQPTQNAALDTNTGLTTGWFGGLVGYDGTVYNQIGDLSQTRLIKLMWLSTIQGRASADSPGRRSLMPFRTDGIMYSPQAVFGFVRSRTSGGDSSIETPTQTQGRWIHNGSLISYELGFLAPGLFGDYESRYATESTKVVDFTPLPWPYRSGDARTRGDSGAGMTLLYDRRMAGFLNISSGVEVKIKPLGGYAQLSR